MNLCLVYTVYTLDIIKERKKLFLTFQLSNLSTTSDNFGTQ